MGFFFFRGRGVGGGTDDDVAEDDEGSERRELKDEMNSIDCGVSPRSSLK
jgi:hypothetical protein